MGSALVRAVQIMMWNMARTVYRLLGSALSRLPTLLPLPVLLLTIFYHLPLAVLGAEPGSKLVLANWRATAFSQSRQGSCCWTTGLEGALRLEVSLQTPGNQPGPEFGPLLAWNGEGWTVILGEAGQGTLNRWGQEWKNTPPGIERLIRAILSDFTHEEFHFSSFIAAGGSGHFRPRPPISSTGILGERYIKRRWEAIGLLLTEETVEISSRDPGSFRNRLTGRGQGRGGSAEMITMELFLPIAGEIPDNSWVPGTRLLVSSSRRSGHLQLDVVDSLNPGEIPSEAFLPIWPLGNFISVD